jgi:thiosulfate dehydrogenase [quinone] large subunit
MFSITKRQTVIEDPPIARILFGDIRLSWLWLLLRLYVGYEWLTAGIEKLQNPVWFGSKAGVGLTGFVQGALQKTSGAHADVQGWYAWFLQQVVLPNAAAWSYMVTIGEVLVGVGLIVGAFTGIAAFFGGFMNANYLMAGTVSTNPMLFVIATWLVLAWKTAGYLGADRILLPALGTPWRKGIVFGGEATASDRAQAPSRP